MNPTSTRTSVSLVTASSPPKLGAQLAYFEPAQITPNGVQVYHCVRSHQCIAYCPLLTVCYLCYNWRPHCWAATAVHHCTWLFVTSLPGYDHPPLCSTSFPKPLLTQREHGRRSLDLYRRQYPPVLCTITAPVRPRSTRCFGAMHAPAGLHHGSRHEKEPFTTVELPPPGLGDRPPCSRHGFRRRPIRAQPTALDA